jgi:hypothetical protein
MRRARGRLGRCRVRAEEGLSSDVAKQERIQHVIRRVGVDLHTSIAPGLGDRQCIQDA